MAAEMSSDLLGIDKDLDAESQYVFQETSSFLNQLSAKTIKKAVHKQFPPEK